MIIKNEERVVPIQKKKKRRRINKKKTYIQNLYRIYPNVRDIVLRYHEFELMILCIVSLTKFYQHQHS